MDDYILAESWKKANIQDRLYYASKEEDMENIESIAFGDKCLVIETGELYIYDADGEWKIL